MQQCSSAPWRSGKWLHALDSEKTRTIRIRTKTKIQYRQTFELKIEKSDLYLKVWFQTRCQNSDKVSDKVLDTVIVLYCSKITTFLKFKLLVSTFGEGWKRQNPDKVSDRF